MKRRIGILGLLPALVLPLVLFFPPRIYGEESVHTVRKGETFYSIARTLGTSADVLMKLNGVTDPSGLREGQRLKVPAGAGTTVPSQTEVASGSGTPAASGGGFTYRVVRGDTFYSLTRKFSVTEAMIREANSLPDTYILREGDSLRIPGAAGTRETSPPVRPFESSRTAEVPRTTPRESEAKPPAAETSVSWPVTAKELSKMTGKLSGVVITGTRTEPVKSLTRGTVLSAGPYRGFGRVAIVQVDGGYLYVYGGCESLSIKEGDRVNPGTEIGKLGIDPKLNEPRLFFMVFRNNVPVDPVRAPRM